MNEKSYITGLFAGDGWFEKRGISIGTNNEHFAKKIHAIMQRVFQRNIIMKKRKYVDGHEMFIVSLHSKDVCLEFKKLLQVDKQKSKNFTVPEFKDETEMRSFIAGIFDAEGSSFLWKNKPRVAMQIYNKSASESIVNSLRKDNVKAYLSSCADGGFKIDATGKHAIRMKENYPFIRLSSSMG